MALILADTDVLIDYLAGAQPTAEHVTRLLAAETLQTSSITCFELLSGAHSGKRGDLIRRLLTVLPILPLDRKAAEHAALVRQQLEQTGRSIGMGDSLIAGVALANSASLMTRNRKHFERVNGLALIGIDQHNSSSINLL